MGEKEISFEVLMGSPQGKDHSKDVSIDGSEN
jgi:hypothetical protein